MQDVMLDIETLAVSPDAVILTFGAVKFNPFTKDIGDGMYNKLDVDHQIKLGRHVDPGTVEWWGKQPKDVQEEAMSEDDRVGLEEFAASLNKFVAGAPRIWAQGPVFDIVILENLYRQLSKPAPWAYYTIRDSRTLLKILGDNRVEGRAQAHNALADCVYQVEAVQAALAKYNIKEA